MPKTRETSVLSGACGRGEARETGWRGKDEWGEEEWEGKKGRGGGANVLGRERREYEEGKARPRNFRNRVIWLMGAARNQNGGEEKKGWGERQVGGRKDSDGKKNK